MADFANCRICGSIGAHPHVEATERMFGGGQVFDYFRCLECGTLQIATIPDDLASYYDPSRYYSFIEKREERGLRLLAKRLIAGTIVGRPDRYPRGDDWLSRVRKGCEPWIATVPGLSLGSRILDFGCGNGAQLSLLAQLGFTNLSGIDKFVPDTLIGERPGGYRLLRGELEEHDGTYDLIMMHHSLEHVPDPKALLEAARNQLAPDGKILVRIPVLEEAIWARYGVNWAQLDAPRHLYLFAFDAFVNLAEKAGLETVGAGYDSMAWSLMWSEAYARGLTMIQPDGSPGPLPFDEAEVAAFAREAEALNAAGKGDQAYFVLQPA